MIAATTTNVAGITAIGRREAMKLQAAELERALELLRFIDAEQWATQTNWPGWDARRMWLHVLGAPEAGASMRENVHQMLAARKRQNHHGTSFEEGLSAVQVAEREDLTSSDLSEGLERVPSKTVRGRGRPPLCAH